MAGPQPRVSAGEKHLTPALPKYAADLRRWFDPELQAAYHGAILPDGKRRLALGMLAFGIYVDRFIAFCLPSLLADGNIGALDEPKLIVHTDAAGAEKIEAALAGVDVKCAYTIIPEDLIDQTPDDPGNKYWLLGASQQLQMQQAKYTAHDYHMLMPDHVYSTDYFAGLDRLAREGKRAIVQGALSARLEDVGSLLDDGRGFSACHLNALALDHLHMQMQRFILNGREGWPLAALMLMVGRDAITTICPHMSVAYLSHDVLMRAPIFLFATVDAHLPHLIPEDVEPYVPVPADRMAYIEVSDDSKGCVDSDFCNAAEFAVRFWVVTNLQRGFERFFALTNRLPLPPGYRCAIVPMGDDEIAARAAEARRSVANGYAAVSGIIPLLHHLKDRI